ncbi:DUF4097 family beta strand repeat-containing protein [Leucobacter salsicius]|uniref:DUF4097 family beta strand repeat-containing protein n=1 Tax=Leucobacter salsicius TaxID=664638 RepID=UPI0003483A8F|nr:DUF4097 family beta strand repeat-containing protein [Leucobacter salsicius]
MSNHIPTPGAPKPARSTASTAILVATSVVGGLALLGTATSAVYGLTVPEPWEVVEGTNYTTEYAGAGSAAELYADAVGVTSIEIDAAASDFTLKYGDVAEAVLTVENVTQGEAGNVNGWTLERDGEDLIVNRELGRRSGDTCLVGCGPRVGGDQTVTLTLPRELGQNRAASLDVQVAAGQFTGTGSYDEVSLEVSAGSLTLKGDARTLDLEVSVGDATVELADVDEADASVTTGDTTVKLTGTAPTLVEVSAEVGTLTAQLPKETYRVDAQADLGSIDNRLEVSKGSKHVVTARAEAAEIVLKH